MSADRLSAANSQSVNRRPERLAIREREILRMEGTLVGNNVTNCMANAIREVLIWARNRRTELPPEALAGETFDYLAGGRNCSAVRLRLGGLDIWAFRGDEPDKFVANRSWITEVVIAIPEGNSPIISARLLANSAEKRLSINAAVPGFIRQISSNVGISCGPYALTDQAVWVRSDDDAHALLDIILNHERTLPVVVISVLSSEGAQPSPPFEVDNFAGFVVGLAHVYVVPAEFTWILSERLGRRLAVFDGGIRIYRVGFSDDDSPYSGFPLIFGRDVEQKEDAAQAAFWLRNTIAHESTRRIRSNASVANYNAIKAKYLQLNQQRLSRAGASDELLLDAANAAIEALEKQIAEGKEWQATLEDDNREFEEKYTVAEGKLRAANYRIAQLQDQLKNNGDTPDASIIIPRDWENFAQWCDDALEGRVVLMPSARRGVRSPLYERPDVVARSLLWLANTYRDARIAGGDNALRDHFLEEGIKNSPCGGDGYKTNWQEVSVDVEWHIKGGGNSRDPNRCLRIYYFWDPSSQQVIIADMPSHTTTGGS